MREIKDIWELLSDYHVDHPGRGIRKKTTNPESSRELEFPLLEKKL